MTVLNTLNFVTFKPLAKNNAVAIRRRKLIAKIEEQIQLAKDRSYSPKKHKWITVSDGNQRKVEVPKRLKRWWVQSSDGKLNLVIRYGSKPLEFAKGKTSSSSTVKVKYWRYWCGLKRQLIAASLMPY